LSLFYVDVFRRYRRKSENLPVNQLMNLSVNSLLFIAVRTVGSGAIYDCRIPAYAWFGSPDFAFR